MSPPVYLDYNATTPVDPRVLESMIPWFTQKFGNAASHSHAYGWEAAEAVKRAREQVALLVGASPAEIVFTSGATESVNTALKGVWQRYRSKGRRIVTLATEHKAVLDTCVWLEKQGAEIIVLPVSPDGLPDLQQVEAAVNDETLMLAVMAANNETGVMPALKTLSAIARKHKAFFFSDATQAVGKVSVNVEEDGIDLMAFSAHKFYGPKGCGALYVRKDHPRVTLSPLLHGGGHEEGMRSGTLNVPGIVGMGRAAEICIQEMQGTAERLSLLGADFLKGLSDAGGIHVHGNAHRKLPNTWNLFIEGVPAAKLIPRVPGVAISTGSACTSAHPEPSHVLRAMGIPVEQIRNSVRISLGRFTTGEEVEMAASLLRDAVFWIRNGG